MKRRLGNLERQLLAYAQMRKVRELRTGDLLKPLGITAKQERELCNRLARAGLIAQVRRGLYLVPRELPLGGVWTPDEALALNTLLADRGGRYQICGPNGIVVHMTYTERGDEPHIISLRRAEKHESRRYAKEITR